METFWEHLGTLLVLYIPNHVATNLPRRSSGTSPKPQERSDGIYDRVVFENDSENIGVPPLSLGWRCRGDQHMQWLASECYYMLLPGIHPK